MNAPADIPAPLPRRPRNLAQGLVESFSERIRGGQIRPGEKLPTESELMRQFGVSRTVVREALSRLQASGLVETHHGVGTYALEPSGGDDFRIDPADIATSRDVMVLLELRVCLESEAAGLAARSPAQLDAMRQALDAFQQALDGDGDTITPDFQFHLLIAQATENRYFADLMSHLGSAIIPRTRIIPPFRPGRSGRLPGARAAGTRGYLRRDPAPGRRSRPGRHAHAPRQQPRAPAPRAIERSSTMPRSPTAEAGLRYAWPFSFPYGGTAWLCLSDTAARTVPLGPRSRPGGPPDAPPDPEIHPGGAGVADAQPPGPGFLAMGPRAPGGLAPLLVGGLRIDVCLLSMVIALPAVFSPWFGHRAWAARATAWWFRVWWMLYVLLEVSTPQFIAEYDTRPNRLYFIYLLNPKEVGAMLWQGYKGVLLAALVVLLVAAWLSVRLFPTRARSIHVLVEAAAGLAADPGAGGAGRARHAGASPHQPGQGGLQLGFVDERAGAQFALQCSMPRTACATSVRRRPCTRRWRWTR